MPNEPLVLLCTAMGKHWRVTLPMPDSYTKCSRARWEEVEPDAD
jgi:hypothetical protein